MQDNIILSGMSQFYWITRLDSIRGICIAIIIIAALCAIWIGFAYFLDLEFNGVSNKKKPFTISIVTLVLFGLLLSFVPTTKEALLIYGVGSTIDYVNGNETIKSLPDKAINALDKYLDSLNKDKDE